MKYLKIPIDLIFIEKKIVNQKVFEAFNTTIESSSVSAPIPIVAHQLFMNLVKLAVCRKGTINNIIENFPNIELSSGNNKRLKEFQKKILYKRWNPFRRTPNVSAIKNDCLIVEDGIEECFILKAIGVQWIRVQLNENLYKKWNDRPVRELKKVVKETKRNNFYNPILHIDYKNVKISRPDSKRIDLIRILLGTTGNGLNGLDIGCNMGYTSHHLARQGYKMTALDFDTYHLKVASALNETYNLNVNFTNSNFIDFNPDEKFDIVVAQTVLYHILFSQKELPVDKIAEKIGMLTKSALLWESGGEPEREKEILLKFSGLTDYLFLSKTEGTGLKREFGVFLRPKTKLSATIKKQYDYYCKFL